MIHVESSVLPQPVESDLIERAAQAVLTHESKEGELTVFLSDDAQLHELNLEYLGIDAPTDVLSFPASETDPESGAAYLGDVIISAARAEEQARSAGHPLEAEVQLLVVHGVLHLLGHDHGEPEDKARMWAAQAQILDTLGLAGLEILES